jgi:hypothetical protein
MSLPSYSSAYAAGYYKPAGYPPAYPGWAGYGAGGGPAAASWPTAGFGYLPTGYPAGYRQPAVGASFQPAGWSWQPQGVSPAPAGRSYQDPVPVEWSSTPGARRTAGY